MIEFTFRTTAFPEDARPVQHTVAVDSDGEVKVWDPVLERWSAEHGMPPGAELAARRLARWFSDDATGQAVLAARVYSPVGAA